MSIARCLPIALCLCLACGPPEGADPELPAGPNLVLLLSDSHRWGALATTQTPALRTPNLDALAGQGASFNRYYVNHPLCTPARAILMTGRWPYQQGLVANHMSLAERLDLPAGQKTQGTLGWMFKAAGYATAYVGKWHLGGRDARPFGFDRSILWSGTNNHRRSRYSIAGAKPVAWSGDSNATAMTRQAIEWLESGRPKDRPFFLILSVNPPHGPFHDAPQRFKALYPDAAALPLQPLDEVGDWTLHRDYHALVSHVDDEVGRILRALDAQGLGDETLVIYTSDHGAMGGVAGVAYGKKRHPHDESTRVPFLVRGLGIPMGLDLNTLASSIDVFPTLAGLVDLADRLRVAGSRRARQALHYLESLPGRDLSGHLRNAPNAPQPESVFLMHVTNMNNRSSRPQPLWRGIVTDRFSYVVSDRGEYALWDNAKPRQSDNLVANPAMLPVRVELWNQLDAWLDRAERPFLDTWFEASSSEAIAAWNAEHAAGAAANDRRAARRAAFELLSPQGP